MHTHTTHHTHHVRAHTPYTYTRTIHTTCAHTHHAHTHSSCTPRARTHTMHIQIHHAHHVCTHTHHTHTRTDKHLRPKVTTTTAPTHQLTRKCCMRLCLTALLHCMLPAQSSRTLLHAPVCLTALLNCMVPAQVSYPPQRTLLLLWQSSNWSAYPLRSDYCRASYQSRRLILLG